MLSNYVPLNLREEISVRDVYSFHYNELSKGFIHSGEAHDFWEFLYLDKGEVDITLDGTLYQLKQGDIVFYAPNVTHALTCAERVPSNIFIVCFDCRTKAMDYFIGKMIRLGNEERHLLTSIIEEGQQSFTQIMDNNKFPNQLIGRTDEPCFGSEQLFKIHLELLLLRLIRNSLVMKEQPPVISFTKEKEESGLAYKIASYLEERWNVHLVLNDVSIDFSMSKTHLNNIFRKHMGCPIMDFYRRLKIDKAKILMREETCNITEIAERMGYSSVHYFSRHFKKMTGSTPSEYLKMVNTKGITSSTPTAVRYKQV